MQVTQDENWFRVVDDDGNRFEITRYGDTLVFDAEERQDGEVYVGQVSFPRLAQVRVGDPKDAEKLAIMLSYWLVGVPLDKIEHLL